MKADNGSSYSIPVRGISVGKHHFDFFLDGLFFEEFDNNDVIGATIHVDMEADRTAMVMNISGMMKGEVTVECDRCLDNLRLPIEVPLSLMVKFARSEEAKAEESDEIVVVDLSEGELDLSQYLYDMAILSLPLQRFHKDGDCNLEMMERLKLLSKASGAGEENPFAALKSLNN